MSELLDKVMNVVRAILRFRWFVLLIATTIALGGWVAVYRIDDIYVARARVFVDSNRILKPLLKGIAIQPDVDERVSLMSRTLLNRPNLEKLARMTDLDVEATTDLEREKLLDRLAANVRLKGTRGNSSLYTVTYRHTDRETAKRVVQALITVFIENTLGDERQDSASAQAFLDQQILDYEGRLLSAERRLSDFKRENAGKMPGEAGGYYQRLDSAIEAERDSRLALREAQNRRDTLRRQVRDEKPTISASGSGSSALENEIRLRQDELDSLLVRFTERHPRISQLRETIARLEQRQEIEERGGGSSRSAGRQIASPVYQQLRGLLAESQARVAELEVRAGEYSDQVAELRATVGTIPRVEAELQELDRDYSVVKNQYEVLLERRESARLSEQVEQNVDDVKFRVIDPPFVGSRPSSPDKPFLSTVVFAAAIGIGCALAFLFSLVRPVFYDSETIARRTGRPVIGTVSRQQSAGATMKKRVGLLIWLSAALLLSSCFAVLMAIHLDMLTARVFEPLLRSRLGPLIQSVLNSFDALIAGFMSLLAGGAQ